VTVTAEAHTLYLQGTGSVTLSGTGSGTLQGTGANDRVSLAFTPTAGTLTLTVSGTVTFGMLCKSSVTDRSYQRVTDWVTEQYAWAAQNPRLWLRRNRLLNTATLSTQTITAVTANPITVSFTGTGKIDFTTAYTGTLQGTGAGDRVTATFTPAAGNLVCTVTGTVTLAQCEVGSTATPYQEVGSSWAATYTALAIAAGYPISLYSDRAGTTATVGPDDPVGVLLDQSENLSGAVGGKRNLLTYSEDFSNAAWNAATLGVTRTASVITSDGTNGFHSFRQLYTHTSNVQYNLQLDVLSGGTVRYIQMFPSGLTDVEGATIDSETGQVATFGTGVSASSSAIVGGFRFVVTYTAISASTALEIALVPALNSERRASSTLAGSITIGRAQLTLSSTTNQSYQKVTDSWFNGSVPGYHATAPSVAGSPTLRLDGNGKFYLDRDTTDDNLPITWPTNLTTTGVIYTATGDYTTKDSGLTLSGATDYKYPQRPSGDYGRIVMASESKYDAKIIKYLDAKRGRSYQLGPELVTNGTFVTDLAGWSNSNSVASRDTTVFTSGGIKVVSSAGGQATAFFGFTTTVGATYKITGTLYCPSTNTAVKTASITANQAGGSTGIICSSEDTFITGDYLYVATATTTYVCCCVLNPGVAWGSTNDAAYFDNISVKQVLI
jgi:hypothetical protein